MAANVSAEEQEQILQTIQMFEVITQANPNDCQSLEILKEAYWKLGKQKEALAVTRKLADTYMANGQYSSALLEYEGILQKEPDSPGVAELLAEVESKLQQPGGMNGSGSAGRSEIDVDFGSVVGQEADLITTQATRRLDGQTELHLTLDNDGNEALAKFLM